MGDVHLPAGWVAVGYGMPGCCARHGEPATSQRKATLMSRPPGWTYALLLAGALPFLIAVLVLRKQVRARAWPLCPRCESLRTTRLATGLGLLGFGVLLFVAGFALGGAVGDGVVALLVVLGLVVLIAGLIVAGRSTAALLARAAVTQDGQWVQVRKADGRFAAWAASTLSAAQAQQTAHAQSYAQQGYAQQPHAQAPYAQAPYAQQPYAQQPYAGQSYAQQPDAPQPPQLPDPPR